MKDCCKAERERWREYVLFICEASDSAWTMAWLHGDRLGEETIQKAREFRAQLGVDDKHEDIIRKLDPGRLPR